MGPHAAALRAGGTRLPRSLPPARQAHTSRKTATVELSASPPDPSVDLEAWVIYTRLAQGLPARVEDPIVLVRIADLLCLRTVSDDQAKHAGEA